MLKNSSMMPSMILPSTQSYIIFFLDFFLLFSEIRKFKLDLSINDIDVLVKVISFHTPNDSSNYQNF